jgi:hypothetical protein
VISEKARYLRDSKDTVAKIHEDEDKLPDIWLYKLGKDKGKTFFNNREALLQRRRGHLGTGTSTFDDCMRAKTRRQHLARKEEKTKYEPGEVLSMDTGIISYRSLEGYKCRQDMSDQGMKKRKHLQNFVRDILAETKDKIKELRVENAQEFVGTFMNDLSREFRFKLKKSARHTHEHAGNVQRAHGIVDEVRSAMMNTACLPHDLLWHLSTQAAVHIKNLHETKGNKNGKSPYEARYGIKPNTDHLRVFGCAEYSPQDKRTRQAKDGQKY